MAILEKPRRESLQKTILRALARVGADSPRLREEVERWVFDGSAVDPGEELDADTRIQEMRGSADPRPRTAREETFAHAVWAAAHMLKRAGERIWFSSTQQAWERGIRCTAVSVAEYTAAYYISEYNKPGPDGTWSWAAWVIHDMDAAHREAAEEEWRLQEEEHDVAGA